MKQQPTRPLTPDQVRARMRREGITLAQWAADRGYKRDHVYRVMGGQYKAYFGIAHQIAIDLGLKLPAADAEQPSTAVGPRNTQSARAA